VRSHTFGGFFVVYTASISHFCPFFGGFLVPAYYFGKNCSICDCAKKPAAPAGFFNVKSRSAFYTDAKLFTQFQWTGVFLPRGVTTSNHQ
jgi:hypothetical protein